MRKIILIWLLVAWIGFFIFPWYIIEDGIWSLSWIFDGYPFDGEYAPAFLQAFVAGKWWLFLIIIPLVAPLFVINKPQTSPVFSKTLIYSGAIGFGFSLIQGFTVGIAGWEFAFLDSLFGELELTQYGLGSGALLVTLSFLFIFTSGLASRGVMKGDVFVVGSIGAVIALVATFVFFPVLGILLSAFRTEEGAFALSEFAEKFVGGNIWSISCFYSTSPCGAAWNSLLLAICAGLLSTVLGLAVALVVTRIKFPGKKYLRSISMLPIITPPFVIGLAIILLFGQAGGVTRFMEYAFGIEPSRWIYGFPGVLFAQVLGFTPITFLSMIGVVEGISPSLEEAAQTLKASRWRTFRTVTLPLIRPGLAAAFLVSFIESLADFGNPMVLGGGFDVLSTQIFFAIAGARNDQALAAILAIILLIFTLGAFFTQRYWVGKKSYITITGKGDSGIHAKLPQRVNLIALSTVIPWTILTIIIYSMILFGGFVTTWGFDHSFTLQHYFDAFAIVVGEHGWVWSGSAWNSFFTTITISAVSAPLTAAVGLLVAYLLVRQTFFGKEVFEFGTMLSFAIPGTVIGVSYVIAFNVPPIELTSTGIILIICFVFRNMPVGVRGGIAAMSQLDQSLDEASLMLGANSFTTVRRVILPLLRPAILSAVTYGFVRAMTAISAVIFLVSADYDMATSYIIGRVEQGEYGIAISYSSILIVIMLLAILLLQKLIGVRKIHRVGTLVQEVR